MGANKTVPRPYSASAATFCLAKCQKLLTATETALKEAEEREAQAANQVELSKQMAHRLLEEEMQAKEECVVVVVFFFCLYTHQSFFF